MTILIIVVVAALIATGAFFLIKSFSGSDDLAQEKTDISQAGNKVNPGAEFEKILTTLLELNILIRTCPGLDRKVLETIESIIDDLKATIPPMMEKYPGETLTYELKKIGSDHLFKSVKEYLDLSDESKKNQASIFNKTLEDLKQVSQRARDIAEKNEIQEFKTMATFLKTKFQTDLKS